MKIIKMKDNRIRIKVDSLNDLYVLERIINKGDRVKAKTLRKFKSNENDKGELKEVILKIEVEKLELDRDNAILRINGKILEGKPEQFITLHAYHTINVKQKSIIEIEKDEWKRYIIDKIIEQSKKSKEAKIGVVILDDESATIGLVSDIGINITTEIDSKLSKRMSQKVFEENKRRYFEEIMNVMNNINTNVFIVGGPGFTKDDFYRFLKDKKFEKEIIVVHTTDLGRAGIKEAIENEKTKKFFERSIIQREFELLNELFRELVIGKGYAGKDAIREHIDEIKEIIVNDNLLNEKDIKELLDFADLKHIKIEIFNSDDDAGKQLKGLGGIAGLT